MNRFGRSLIAVLVGAVSIRPAASADLEAGRGFWAFQPPRPAASPAVRDTGWPKSDIDRFILARLEQEGRHPTRDADRRTLIRRIYFDLVGLPPPVAAIDAFVQDDSADAVARWIDRLLDSPQFGARWGRHWLDVVRYADSSGGGRSLLFPDAWRYRDYVIDSFNRDTPYPQFIRAQIAGDLLPFDNPDQRARQLIATGFLMLGAHNYELQDKELLRMDVADEQIEAVGRALLGMTLGCARCHDHKFDPIPTADYYALAGILRSTKSLTPGNVSGFEQHELPMSDERRIELDNQRRAVAEAEAGINAARAELKKLQARWIATGAGQLVGVVVDDTQAKIVGSWTRSTFNPGYVGEGYIHDGASGKGEKSVTFPVTLASAGVYEVRFSYTHGSNRSPSVPVTVRHADDEDTVQVDERQAPPIDHRFVALGRWRFPAGTSDAVVISNEGTTGHVIVDAVQFVAVELLDKPAGDAAQTIAPGTAGPRTAASGGAPPQGDDAASAPRIAELQRDVKELEGRLRKLKENAPEPPPRAMGVRDEQEPGDFHVCIRGDVHNLGPEVPRGFLCVAGAAGAPPPVIASGESGRRELAEWLVSPDNPLPARVMVNRIWHHLMGAGLVRTVDNFGSTGEAPSHPELLDWLALRFIAQGWSVKAVIRDIMLSRTYQLASEPDGAVLASARGTRPALDGGSGATHPEPGDVAPAAADPENRLLARMNRKRLDAEELRDAMLSVSGQLDVTPGGPAIRSETTSEYGYIFDSNRRSVYLPVFRNNLPDIFEVFDFADPNRVTGRRDVSTLPTQALYLMNSPFVFEQARHAAEAILENDTADADRVELAYRGAIGRPPEARERELALRYIEAFRPGKNTEPARRRLEAWTRFYQVLFASVDFRYLH